MPPRITVNRNNEVIGSGFGPYDQNINIEDQSGNILGNMSRAEAEQALREGRPRQ